jgi:hypothetical protein
VRLDIVTQELYNIVDAGDRDFRRPCLLAQVRYIAGADFFTFIERF